MKKLLAMAFMHVALCSFGQDSLRVQLLMDAGVGRTFFNAHGDEYLFLDSYRTEGNSYSGGVHLRFMATRKVALRFGIRAFSRDFGSLTFDYRMPINSQQTGYSPNDQFTRLACLGVPMTVEMRPVPWLSLLAGVQGFAVIDQTSRPWGDDHSAPVDAGSVELSGQLEVWPMPCWGLALRYFHPTQPMRDQAIWRPEQAYRRTTHWRTVEVGMVLKLASFRAPNH